MPLSPRARAHLARFNKPTVEEMEEAVSKGEARLWEKGDCAAITQDATYREIICAAGKMEDIVSLLPEAEKGVQRVIVAGRAGWERVLKPHGFRRVVCYIKDT